MKWVKKCPVLFILVISGTLFTMVGIAGKNSIYKDYEYNFTGTPFLALMMEGISKGEYPWDYLSYGAAIETVSETLNLPMGNEEDEDTADGKTELFEEEIPEDDVQESTDSNEEVSVDKSYDFIAVGEEYFDDAVFIGDSRTVGLFEYGGIENRSDFFAKTSLTIYDALTALIAKDEETGEKITVEEALQKKQYGKVYLMLGINELGTGTTETFMEEYKKVVKRLEELQPDAIIYVEGIMRVTGTKNESDPIFNNTNINERNEEIEKLADNKKIFYIDVNEVVCDGQGNLNDEYTTDEIHLKAQYYQRWKEFLLTKGIERDGE
ncbi:MAG: acylhydrolase [Clostridiales bacterium]|nr:acylhydrolase [Clostridiales bacterium]